MPVRSGSQLLPSPRSLRPRARPARPRVRAMSSDLRESPAPRRGPLSWLMTSNPLYVVSAGLFLFGLRVSFGEQTRDIDTWALMLGLGGYTLLLAAAALVL